MRRRLLLAALMAVGTVSCAVALAGTAGWLLATAAGQPPVLTLSVAVVAVRAFGLGRGLSRYVERLAGHDAALRVLATTRADVWAALEPLVPAGLPDGPTGGGGGEVLERLVGDVDALQDLYLRALPPVAVALAVGGGAVAVTTSVLPSAGLVLAVGLVAAAVGIPACVLLLDRRSAALRLPARSQLTQVTVDLLAGAADLEAFGASESARRRVVTADQVLRRTDRSAAAATGVADGLQTLTSGLLIVGVLLVGLPAVAAGTIDGVGLAVLALIAWSASEATAGLPDAARAVVAGRAAAVRLLEVLDARPTVTDPARPEPVPAGPLGLHVAGLQVAHPGATRPALVDVDLDLPPGRRVAVVGPSGAGKSTLVDVLLRFREPTAGRVLLGGVDVRRLAQAEVREAVSGCLQRPYLFATTLLDDLRLARPDASADDVAVAAAAAGLADWVEELPRGWQTLAGEAGAMVSGGQAQRLGLARALLHSPRVLVLDEPTSGLEPALADQVMADVLRATAGRTLLLVTHRLAGLDAVDQVVVLDQGRVVQCGSAEELRGRSGLFRTLWDAERAGDRLQALQA